MLLQALTYSGTLRWGEAEEAVSGGIGWLDRQWFPDYAGRYAGVLADHWGHQWTQISLDTGGEFGLWRQFDREADDRTVMFSGLTATDPAGTTLFADDVVVDVLTMELRKSPRRLGSETIRRQPPGPGWPPHRR